MQNMTLQNMADACSGTLYCKEELRNQEITCAVIDSRKIEQGGLFFATKGEKVDGHRFIGQVFEKGALCVVTEKTPEQVLSECEVPVESWGAYILVKDSFLALKQIAAFYRKQLKIPVVGITGSVGKTSTKEFIAGVLSVHYNVLKTEGNFNNEVGLPLTLLRIRGEHEAAVVEMGISDFGEMSRLGAMARPNICVITNIGQCHLENLHDRAGIFKAKTEIFDYLSENGEVCLNGEDDMLAAVSEVSGKEVHHFGLSENAGLEVYATNVENLGLLGSRAVMHICMKEADAVAGNGRQEAGAGSVGQEPCADIACPVEIPLPGQHMVINAMAAAQVGRLLGLTVEEIQEGIKSVKPVGGRSNILKFSDKIIIDDCYNANPVSMKAALELLKTAIGRKVAVLGDMFELGENSDAMHAGVGAYAVEQGIDVICCVGANSHHMYEAAVATVSDSKVTAASMVEKSPMEINVKSTVYYFATREDLLAELPELLQSGDTILVKASHGMGFDKVVE
ncbi:MAG: UDP-N-acetylmuramoyl-tripeptide--D-alanyl-D-alanine ligase, partial [Lachnospiraceae bacterium]|nr:UDP-N-acetylmuramoyl-tripeptide--D-alanyl-D-alanine ligase [Lachnospiraceae bacterium]